MDRAKDFGWIAISSVRELIILDFIIIMDCNFDHITDLTACSFNLLNSPSHRPLDCEEGQNRVKKACHLLCYKKV